MKTPWEIQRSLFCCTEYECHKCYYEKECEGRKMAETLLPDVLDFVVELKKERDAALYDMHQLQGMTCGYCKHLYHPDGAEHPRCREFGEFNENVEFSPLMCGKFEWRGVCEENTKGAGE